MNAPEIITILGKGSAFDGKLTFEGKVRIDGEFSGEIRTDGTLVVGESAKVTAQIDASTVVIEGRVEGDIRATTLVELHGSAHVVGTLDSPSLEIQRGAVFDGRCSMKDRGGSAETDKTAVAGG
ncbi:MAG: polymer-forming cytoskeletal protein [Myxococcales bacterium]|nr:polymer-forming cytoskeletal protein [Myxococcales bacterium]MCB9713078.1 polymer-forming cytoskeletal protein [Myxococcales bacterium]